MLDTLSPSPRKIFCLSLHKTGTTSFQRLMEANGLASIHGAKWLNGVNYRPPLEGAKEDRERIAEVLEPFLEHYEAFSDTPYNAIYPQLARKYPDAFFVLVTRDMEAWWNSIQKHWTLGVLGHHLTMLEYIQYHPYIADCSRVFTARDRNEIVDAHHRHIEEVTAALSGHRFLRVELEDPGIHAKIATFLALGDAKPFPHARKSGSPRDAKRVWKNIRLRFRHRHRHRHRHRQKD